MGWLIFPLGSIGTRNHFYRAMAWVKHLFALVFEGDRDPSVDDRLNLPCAPIGLAGRANPGAWDQVEIEGYHDDGA